MECSFFHLYSRIARLASFPAILHIRVFRISFVDPARFSRLVSGVVVGPSAVLELGFLAFAVS